MPKAKRTPPNEIHLSVEERHPLVPAPEGTFIRMYQKRRGGVIYWAWSFKREDPWYDMGAVSMEALHWLLYVYGVADNEPPEIEDNTVDFMEEYEKRRTED